MFQSIEHSPAPGGLPRTDALEGGDKLAGEDMMKTDHKDKPLVADVLASGSNRQRHSMAIGDVKGLIRRPEAINLESAQATLLDVEDGLDETPLPKLRFGARCQTLLPLIRKVFGFALPKAALPEEVDEGELVPTQRATTLLPVKGSLMEGSEARAESVARHLLQSQTDLPIQDPLQVMAAFIPCDTEEALPAKFFTKLELQNGPAVSQAEVAVRDTTITGALPHVPI